MKRPALVVICIAAAFPASALERASTSQLKAAPPPARHGTPSSSSAPAPVPPTIATPTVRLFGASAKKDGPSPVPALVATAGLHLLGPTGGAPVATAKLLLLGAPAKVETAYTTSSIRLWGTP